MPDKLKNICHLHARRPNKPGEGCIAGRRSGFASLSDEEHNNTYGASGPSDSGTYGLLSGRKNDTYTNLDASQQLDTTAPARSKAYRRVLRDPLITKLPFFERRVRKDRGMATDMDDAGRMGNEEEPGSNHLDSNDITLSLCEPCIDCDLATELYAEDSISACPGPVAMHEDDSCKGAVVTLAEIPAKPSIDWTGQDGLPSNMRPRIPTKVKSPVSPPSVITNASRLSRVAGLFRSGTRSSSRSSRSMDKQIDDGHNLKEPDGTLPHPYSCAGDFTPGMNLSMDGPLSGEQEMSPAESDDEESHCSSSGDELQDTEPTTCPPGENKPQYNSKSTDNKHSFGGADQVISNTADVTSQPECKSCLRRRTSKKKAAVVDEPVPGASEIFWCPSCGMHLCDPCWKEQLAHDSEEENDGMRVPSHEKIGLQKYKMMKALMRTADGEDHVSGQNSKWFGVNISDRKRGKDAHLTLTTRYHELSLDSNVSGAQFPVLVTFIGETGVGKSSLVRALVKIMNVSSGSQTDAETPVVSTHSVEDVARPTSSDVHLFSDPKTRQDNFPRLYADCEGLQGGNSDPRAVLDVAKATQNLGSTLNLGVRRNPQGKHFRKWKLGGIEERDKYREWMVKNLYTRILFTFSDVVCYITKNPKTIESIIGNLVEWAHAVLESSINQPVLPGAIIVINAFDLAKENAGTSLNYYKDDFTDKLLKDSGPIEQICQAKPLADILDSWKNIKKPIHNLRDLIFCYFSSFRIICIPHDQLAPGLLIDQYQALYDSIGDATQSSRFMRKQSGLLLDWDELDMYLNSAFNQFSQDHKLPFNFLDAAFRHHPVGASFHTHLMTAALRLKDQIYNSGGSGDIFMKLAPFIASCILLDVCRKRVPQKEEAPVVLANYKENLLRAYELFHRDVWPCAFSGHKGNCVNVASKHKKGHQLANGKIFAPGEYVSPNDTTKDCDRFLNSVNDSYVEYLKELLKATDGDSKTQFTNPAALHTKAIEQHRRVLAQDHLGFGSSPEPPSHITCYGCLCSVPNRTLTCGHLLCNNCCKDFTPLRPRQNQPSSLVTEHEKRVDCPFYSCNGCITLYEEPVQAAPRILSLDGGGIRSIIQLKLLAALEDRIALGIPIQDFFDMVIGTSAGGIVALSLVQARLPVHDCIDIFRSYASKAFTRRFGHKIAAVSLVVEAHKHSRYRSGNVKEMLKEIFGEGTMLFGEPFKSKYITGDSRDCVTGNQCFGFQNKEINEGVSCRSPGTARVGVTLTSSSGRSLLVANYNHSHKHEVDSYAGSDSAHALPNKNYKYGFLRSKNKETEFKVWEAALATTAAPRYFKPFNHKATGCFYTDGGINFNNPVCVADRERQRAWPCEIHAHPDILLSLGTGYVESDNVENHELPIPPAPEPEDRPAPWGAFSYFQKLKLLVSHQTLQQLDSRKMWDEFITRKDKDLKSEEMATKYQRIDIPLKHLVKLHHVHEIQKLETTVHNYALSPATSPRLGNIAAQLVASLFYFELDTSKNIPQMPVPPQGERVVQSKKKKKFQVQGKIRCRLPTGTQGYLNLCQKFRRDSYRMKDTIFQIGRYGTGARDQVKNLGPKEEEPDPFDILRDPKAPFEYRVTFRVPDSRSFVRIYLQSEYTNPGSPLPCISGFPCELSHLQSLHKTYKAQHPFPAEGSEKAI